MDCRICGNAAENTEYEAREMLFGYRDEYLYFQCSRCGCLQISEIPEDMGQYYESSYYSYEDPAKRGLPRRLAERARSRYAVFGEGLVGRALFGRFPTGEFQFLSSLRGHYDTSTRFLDVGCGAGRLVHALCELGFRNVCGVDPFIESDIHYPNGLAIGKQYVHEVQGEFDIVMFHDSFEHVPDPIETLESAYELLVPGGWCIIRVPTVSSYAWMHYGVDWIGLDAPRHLYLHSVESMEMVATAAGFESSKTVFESNAFQFWGSEQCRMDIALTEERSHQVNPRTSHFSRQEIARFAQRAEELNAAQQGDHAVFYLRRPVPATDS